jgi:tetratricopeptide (TPR) repeat protein
MGLNRQIVIGLIALEMTEKTAAARIEALARQSAKQRGVQINLAARRMSLGPRFSVPGERAPAVPSKKAFVLDGPTPGLGGIGLGKKEEAPAPPDLGTPQGAPAKGRKPSDMMAAPGEIPAAPRMPGETAIGLPEPPKKRGPPPGRPAARGAAAGQDEPDAPPPPTSAPPGPAGMAESLSPSILESLPVDVPHRAAMPEKNPEMPEKKQAPRPRNLKKTLVGLAAPPGGAPAPESPDEFSSQEESSSSTNEGAAPDKVTGAGNLNLDEIDSIVPESLSPSEMASVPAEGLEEGPQVPRAAGLPNFDPSELLADASEDSGEITVAGRSPLLEAERGRLPDTSDGSPEEGFEPRSEEEMASEAEAGPPPSSNPFGLDAVVPGDDSADGGALPPMEFGATVAEPLRSPLSPTVEESFPEQEDQLPEEGELRLGQEQEEAEEPPLPPEASLPPPGQEGATSVGAESPGLEGQMGAAGVPKKGGGKGLLVAAMVLIFGGAAAGYVFVNRPELVGLTARPAQIASSSEPTEPESVQPEAQESGEEASDASAEEAQPAVPSDAGTPEAEDGSEGERASSEETGSQAAESGSDGNTAEQRGEPAGQPSASPKAALASPDSYISILDNPFKIPDKKLPGCSELAPDAKPETSDPVTEASTHWAAARKLIVKGDVKGASQAMCVAVAINPESPANEGLARLYVLAYSPAEAMVWVDKALKLAPDDRDLLSLRGDIESQLGNQEAATEDWLRALSLDPGEEQRRKNQAREYATLARKHRSRGDLPKAEQFYRRALGLDPDSIAALSGMADVLFARELYDQAGTFAVKALEIFEPNPEAHVVLGDIAAQKNQPEAARASYQRALAARPDFWPAKKALADLNR